MWKEEEEGWAEKERGIKTGCQSINVVFCGKIMFVCVEKYTQMSQACLAKKQQLKKKLVEKQKYE